MAGEKKDVRLTVKFGGKPSQVNVETYLSSLAGLTSIMDELNAEVGDGQQLKIVVRAHRRGSFYVDLGLIPSQVMDLIRSLDLETTAQIVGITAGLLAIRKFLKGEKPEKVQDNKDNVTITAKSGSSVTVQKKTFDIYISNLNINTAITRIFRGIEEDESIDSFEIKDEHKQTVFSAKRNDFGAMAMPHKIEAPEKGPQVAQKTVTLNIFRVVFDNRCRWAFIWEGRHISATIPEEFFKRIKAGEKFSMGDTLDVRLQISRIFDSAANTYIDDSYQILEVIKHTPRPEALRLDL